MRRPRSVPARAAGDSSLLLEGGEGRGVASQAADAEAAVGRTRWRPAAVAFALHLDLQDRTGGEQVGAQVLVQLGVATAEPFQRHRRVLLLLVAVVGEDGAQLGVVGGVDAL